MDRGGLEALAAVRLTERIGSSWECASLDLRHHDSTLVEAARLKEAGQEVRETLRQEDPPAFLWGAGAERLAATTIVALERKLPLASLSQTQEHYLAAEGEARNYLWDQASGLHLPVHLYEDVRHRIHERPLEAFDLDYRETPVLVGPDGRTPLRKAVADAIARPRSRIAVPELPAPPAPEAPRVAAEPRSEGPRLGWTSGFPPLIQEEPHEELVFKKDLMRLPVGWNQVPGKGPDAPREAPKRIPPTVPAPTGGQKKKTRKPK